MQVDLYSDCIFEGDGGQQCYLCFSFPQAYQGC
uniref:Uncharacterized protein n=1 Tax=Anguilla anguilla TaxID=7936 RepID=A0A0E9R5D3_ANGAN